MPISKFSNLTDIKVVTVSLIMEQAIIAVSDGMPIRKAAELLCIPYATLPRKCAALAGTSKKPLSPVDSEKLKQQNIRNACDSVRSKKMSMKGAAKFYSVNYSTLHRHFRNPDVNRRGGKQKLNPEIEDDLADLLLTCAIIGIPLNKSKLRVLFTAIGKERRTLERDHRMSNKWYRNFLKRHPNIAERVSFATNRKSAREWTKKKCEAWFALLQEASDDGYLADPCGISNFDESAFQLAEKYDKMLAWRGTNEVSAKFDGDGKERLTVLAGGRTDGLIFRSLVLYNGAVNLLSRFDGVGENCWIPTNPSGWMDPDISAEYLQVEVIPKMNAQKNIVFFEGHWSHIYNLKLIRNCAASGKNIRIIVFPSGQTSHLPPLDKSVFGPVKCRWRNHLRSPHNALMLDPLCRNNFPSRLISLWDSFNMSVNIKSGFRACGIFPFAPDILLSSFDAEPNISGSEDQFRSPKRRLLPTLAEMNLSPENATHVVNSPKN